MACPVCGEDCSCSPKDRAFGSVAGSNKKPKFEIDSADNAATLVDPEAYDASEQEFAVSLEQPALKSKFVVEPDPQPLPSAPAPLATVPEISGLDHLSAAASLSASSEPQPSLPMPTTSPESKAPWREEIAARLNTYRARRAPKEPKFPSLRLKFEANESGSDAARNAASEPAPQSVLVQQTIPVEEPLVHPPGKAARVQAPRRRVNDFLDNSARILEFPRLHLAPPRRVDELADPILERPRILEVQEAPSPGPALGGIIIGPTERAEERHSEFEVPLQAATISRRAVATAIDGLLIAGAVALFAYIFQSLTRSATPSSPALIGCAILFGIFWSAYHLLLLPYCGATLGLRLTRLQLRRFNGKPVTRPIRGWRALAAILSAVSVGLGYLWCLLDEDQLCWHDRITRTYVSPL